MTTVTAGPTSSAVAIAIGAQSAHGHRAAERPSPVDRWAVDASGRGRDGRHPARNRRRTRDRGERARDSRGGRHRGRPTIRCIHHHPVTFRIAPDRHGGEPGRGADRAPYVGVCSGQQRKHPDRHHRHDAGRHPGLRALCELLLADRVPAAERRCNPFERRGGRPAELGARSQHRQREPDRAGRALGGGPERRAQRLTSAQPHHDRGGHLGDPRMRLALPNGRRERRSRPHGSREAVAPRGNVEIGHRPLRVASNGRGRPRRGR